MALSVLGLQQSSSWGWDNPLTWGSIAAGLLLLVAFTIYELRMAEPLIRMQIFKVRAFFAENVVLFIAMVVFVPLFFFASMYAQLSLDFTVSNAGLYLLVFFAGFAPAAQVGGRILDKSGAKPAVVLGCLVAAVGFGLWAWKMTDISGGLGAQWIYIVIAGAGIGLMLGPSNTDAINRAPSTSYGEATGVTQTVRNYGSSLGMAVLGTILLTLNKSNMEASLSALGIPTSQADQIADGLTSGGGDLSAATQGMTTQQTDAVYQAIQLDFAEATQVVFYVMAGVMAAAFLAALVGLQKGKQAGIVEVPS